MKRFIFSTLLLLLCVAYGHAQQKVYIHLNDSTIALYVWQIDSITFTEDEPLTPPSKAEQVDLGLSVKWANFNLGAETESGVGYLVGWGDITGRNHSSNKKYFPVEKPTGHIVADKFDIAKKMWGDLWRLPTQDEIQELIDSCDWVWETVDGVGGYRVTGKAEGTGNIFLPVTGQRYEETISEEGLGYYWSGMLNTENIDEAIALNLSDTEKKVLALQRYLGLAIRPVYGEYIIPVSIKLNEATDINYTNVVVSGTFDGDYQYATSYGVLYGKTVEELDIEGSSKKETEGAPTSKTFSYELKFLEEAATYYYVAYAKVNDSYVYSDTLTFTLLSHFPVAEYVDLGLSVKWASWNMGASSDQEVGGYYGWGDATGTLKSRYNNDYAVGNTKTDIAGTKYDLAHAKWGGKWRMPTQAEFEELKQCTWKFTSSYKGTGIKGYIISGKPGSGMENNSIFMPRAGVQTYNGVSQYYNTDADYWTSECQSDNVKAYFVTLVTGPNVQIHTSDKNQQVPIRPVYAEATSGGSGGDTPGGDTPGTGGDTPGGDTPGTGGSDNPGNQTITEGKAVDLGLSVKWADMNVGAKTSTDYGYYYAWGETEPKDSYTFDNYQYKIDGATDYNVQESYMEIGTDIKNTNHDVAHVKWGGKWRMPTEKEIFELINKCTWTWEDGGYRVTATNGKSIFLPATGYYNGSSLYFDYTQARYWSSDVNVYKDSYHAWARAISLVKSTDSHFMGSYVRTLGCAIRPVQDK